MHASHNWNHLHPDQHPPALSCSPAVTRGQRKRRESDVCHVSGFTPSGWEAEAILRYRALKDVQVSNLSACMYVSSNASHSCILRMILESKLLPITDWCECAKVVASWFRNPVDAPLSLLSYAAAQLVASHSLTPGSAAKWVLDVGKAMLTAENASEPRGVFSLEDWDIVEELVCSVYTMQKMQLPLFESFSSVLLDVAIEEMFSGACAQEPWVLLPLCFLVKRNKDFALLAWNSDDRRHRSHIQRVCDLSRDLPLHVTIVLTSLV